MNAVSRGSSDGPLAMTQPRSFSLVALLVGLLALALPPMVSTSFVSTALAQTVVVVNVRGADGALADARVTLTPEAGGQGSSCRTAGGTCRLSGIAPGRYVVTAEPSGAGQPPIPRPVPIPPGSEVTVHVTLR
jgi:hypothetical protein